MEAYIYCSLNLRSIPHPRSSCLIYLHPILDVWYRFAALGLYSASDRHCENTNSININILLDACIFQIVRSLHWMWLAMTLLHLINRVTSRAWRVPCSYHERVAFASFILTSFSALYQMIPSYSFEGIRRHPRCGDLEGDHDIRCQLNQVPFSDSIQYFISHFPDISWLFYVISSSNLWRNICVHITVSAWRKSKNM